MSLDPFYIKERNFIIIENCILVKVILILKYSSYCFPASITLSSETLNTFTIETCLGLMNLVSFTASYDSFSPVTTFLQRIARHEVSLSTRGSSLNRERKVPLLNLSNVTDQSIWEIDNSIRLRLLII